MVFDEEFNGSSLDTTRWQPGWFGTGITQPVNQSELACYDSRRVSVSGGYLRLQAAAATISCGGKQRSYSSGMVTTNPSTLGKGKGFQFTYGAVEFRIYVPANAAGQCANWPAAWTNGQTWPADGEIDAYECLSGTSAWHLHSAQSGGAATGPGGYPMLSAGGWHTAAAVWGSTSVTFYYDGKYVGSHAYSVTGPNYLVLNLGVGDTSKVVAPAEMLVDYVRVWQAR